MPQADTSKGAEEPHSHGHSCGIHSYLNANRTLSSSTQAATSMPVHKDFVAKNTPYVETFGEKAALPLKPGKKLAIVTCMDARINVYAELGIDEGDAHIIRNAGGSAKDALRSIIISQRLLGTREIAVFHHTDCGMLTFTTPELRTIVKSSTDDPSVAQAVDKIEFLEFSELEQSVKEDVKYLKENPLVLPETEVTGWVYEVGTGKVRRVV
ncbi:carbonic anhydrase [Irpex rosettiformis]|uniref:Carbonic anhydrase n=1 Tax=Irpex rosettiformis TaxID=378272 RepID=A0ACB8UMG0_9APHY|nr:carbonic anhydrase [Irpex rosettiformis]